MRKDVFGLKVAKKICQSKVIADKEPFLRK